VENERKRKVTVRVLPHEGYDVGAELERDTPLEEVLETLGELGFAFSLEEISERDSGYETGLGAELIEGIFHKFLSITRDYGESMRSVDEFYERWVDVGFDIVDLKNIIQRVNRSQLNGGNISEIVPEIDDMASGPENTPLDLRAVQPLADGSPHLDEVESGIESDDSPLGDGTAVSGSVARSGGEGSGHSVAAVPNDDEGSSDTHSLFPEEEADSCRYCGRFRDIGTMVCPHCGRPLNLRTNDE
jgi:hypothetical protein